MADQAFSRILIVEDDVLFRRSLRRFALSITPDVLEADSVAEATELLAKQPQLVLLDVRLSDGTGIDVAETASKLMPAPLVVAFSGEASAGEAFRLAQLGVRQYLQKPFRLEELDEAIMAAQAGPPVLQPHIAGAVGHLELSTLKSQVRYTMVRQALALTGGNRSAAARMLGVSRQALQHIVRHDASLGRIQVPLRDTP